MMPVLHHSMAYHHKQNPCICISHKKSSNMMSLSDDACICICPSAMCSSQCCCTLSQRSSIQRCPMISSDMLVGDQKHCICICDKKSCTKIPISKDTCVCICPSEMCSSQCCCTMSQQSSIQRCPVNFSDMSAGGQNHCICICDKKSCTKIPMSEETCICICPAGKCHAQRMMSTTLGPQSTWSPCTSHVSSGEHKLTTFSDKDGFHVKLNTQHFKPEELIVKHLGDTIKVSGKHEERLDEHGYVSRQFERRFNIPDEMDVEHVLVNLSSDGILTLVVPKKAMTDLVESEERVIPIVLESASPSTTHE